MEDLNDEIGRGLDWLLVGWLCREVKQIDNPSVLESEERLSIVTGAWWIADQS